jgi:hypothetical protein
MLRKGKKTGGRGVTMGNPVRLPFGDICSVKTPGYLLSLILQHDVIFYDEIQGIVILISLGTL